MSDKIPIFRIAPAPRGLFPQRHDLTVISTSEKLFPAVVALKDRQGLSTHIGSATQRELFLL